MRTRVRKYIRLVCIIIFAVFLLLLLYKFVSGTKNADTVEFISEKKLTGIVREITGANRQQRNADSNEEADSEIEHSEDVKNESESEEELRKRVCERIKAIDFSAGVHPVNTEVYDSEMDREYKEAFLQMLFNQIPIQYEEQGEIYYRESDRWCFGDLDDAEYVRAIKNPNFRYHYMDFDGDGLPELIVRPESWDVHFGLHIFKYNSDDKKIYNLGSENRYSGWDLLGSGKLYYIDSTVATLWYGYQEINASGEQTKTISFTVVSGHDYDEYEVDVDYSQDVTLSEDEWNEITQDYFKAIDNAPAGMTFEELFGDVEYPYI